MRAGRRVGVIAVSEGLRRMRPTTAETCDLGPISDLPQVARRLFAGLRTLESANVDLILAHTLPPEGLGLAINDRLRRAADRVVPVGPMQGPPSPPL
jgi:L-threonylcarbamoyladenylate synthase